MRFFRYEAAVKFIGISKDEIIGRSLIELFPSHSSSGLLEKYSDVADKEGPLRLDAFKYEGSLLFHKKPEAQELLKQDNSSYSHRMDKFMIGEAIMSGSTVFLPFVDSKELKKISPEADRKYIDMFGIFTLLIVPLKIQGKTIGMILLLRDETEQP